MLFQSLSINVLWPINAVTHSQEKKSSLSSAPCHWEREEEGERVRRRDGNKEGERQKEEIERERQTAVEANYPALPPAVTKPLIEFMQSCLFQKWPLFPRSDEGLVLFLRLPTLTESNVKDFLLV